MNTTGTTFPLIGLTLLAAFLAGCAAPAQQPVAAQSPKAETSPRSATPAIHDDLQRIQAALLPPLLPEVARPGEPRFDLRVTDAPADEVFRAIVSGTRYGLLVHPGVNGRISLNLTDVTVEGALNAIREAFGYEYRIDGNRIAIQPAVIQSRVFRVNYPAGRREGSSETFVASPYGVPSTSSPQEPAGSAAMPDAVSRSRTTVSGDFWSELRNTLLAMAGATEGRSVAVNPQAGIVVARAMPRELRQMERYLNAVRDSVQRQVQIEARIVEVTLNENFRNGIDWERFAPFASGTGTAAETPGTGAPAAGLFGLALNAQSFDSLLEFLGTQGQVHVLSSPRLSALNNQKALLKAGTDEFHVTGVNGAVDSGGGTGGRGFPTISTRPFFTGVSLDITPQIDEDSGVILHIHPSVTAVSQTDRPLNLGSGIGAVSIPLARSAVSESDSVVRARDGNFVVIGGMMNGGAAAGSSGNQDLRQPPAGERLPARRELVVLLKPTVVPGDAAGAGGISGTRADGGWPAGSAAIRTQDFR